MPKARIPLAIALAATLIASSASLAAEPKIVAHRGASKAAPENTLPAFELAWQQGADAIEGDFWLTQDGHVVCIHDKDTKRVSKTNLQVSRSTLSALQALDVGSHHSNKYAGTRIPTIEQVFQTIPPNKQIYIEIKCGPEIVPALLKEIQRSKLKPNQIVIISFNTKVIKAIKAKSPNTKSYWLTGIKRDRSGVTTPSPDSALATLKRIQADGLSSNKNIDQKFAKQILANGYEWHIWTIDDTQTAKRFAGWGVMSITTNRPKFIRSAISK